jgi:hypothetical protein
MRGELQDRIQSAQFEQLKTIIENLLADSTSAEGEKEMARRDLEEVETALLLIRVRRLDTVIARG